MKNIQSLKAFTLIELMIVISIISILAVGGMALFYNVQIQARDASRKQDIANIAHGLDLHADFDNDTQPYPPVTGSLFREGLVPKDPKGGNYFYNGTTLSSGGTSYTICAKLEIAKGNSSSQTGTPTTNGQYFCKSSP